MTSPVTKAARAIARRALATIVSITVAGFCAAVLAQDYPAKAVRIIFPYPPGGQPDIVLRLIAQQFSTQFGQPFQVEHLPGSGGMVATTNIVLNPEMAASTILSFCDWVTKSS